MSWYTASTLVAFIINFSLTIFVYLRSRGKRNVVLFANMLAMASIWILGSFFVNISGTAESGLLWNRLLHIGAIMVVPTFFHFAWDFNKGKEKKGFLLVALMYIGNGSLLLFLFNPLLVKSVSRAEYIGYAYAVGPLYYVYGAFFLLASLYGVVATYKTYKASEGYLKTKAKYFLVSLTLAVATGIVFFLMTIAAPIKMPPIDNFVAIIFSVTFTYAMLTHRLVEIRVAITKIFLFFAIPFIAVSVYSAIFGIIFWLISGMINYTAIIGAAISFLLAIGTLPPLRKGLLSYIDEIAYGGDYNYRILMNETTQALVSMLDMQELLGYLTDTINQTFEPQELSLFLKEGRAYNSKATSASRTINKSIDQDNALINMLVDAGNALLRVELDEKQSLHKKIRSTLNALRAEIIVPLFAKDQLSGFLAMDIKKTGKSYSPRDIEALNAMASTAGIALQNAQLYEEAITDGLTGLYHHKYFHARIKEELSRAKRYFYPISVVMIDIDFFKKVNDKYGHQTGDQVLEEIAEIIESKTRIFDVVARYGGEEFAILLPSIGKETYAHHKKTVFTVAERLRKKIQESKFSDQNIDVTISAGIALFNGKDEEITSTLIISEADKQLYRAKQSGRNIVCKIDISKIKIA